MLRRLPKPETKLPPVSAPVRTLQNSLKLGTADTNPSRPIPLGTKPLPGTLDQLGKAPARRPIKVKLSEHTSSGQSGTGGDAAGLHRSRCSVCRHKDANAIAIEIISGASMRSVADRYHVSKSALTRHAIHLPENLIQARLSSQIAEQELLLADIVQHEADLKTMFREVRDAKNRGEATQVSGALLRTFELLRKMVVEQKSRNSQPAGAGSDETAALIGKVLQVLQEHPDARIKLAEALSPSAKPPA
jgi:hypothetical protein